ncbi:MAG TPA: NUDIX domain-containing protein [Chloroflexota bacterium]|nr:NUDIX domain-containing protein [Chloroflexota bacterium]
MSATRPIREKVVAYITHGRRLLVFRHVDFLEAGIQVPAGTVEPGEDPADAVRREALEETGLPDLALVRFLGEQTHDLSGAGGPEWQRRRFYHLRCDGEPPEAWRHVERDPSDGSAPLTFELFWARVPDGVPSLAAEQNAFLDSLLSSLQHDR